MGGDGVAVGAVGGVLLAELVVGVGLGSDLVVGVGVGVAWGSWGLVVGEGDRVDDVDHWRGCGVSVVVLDVGWRGSGGCLQDSQGSGRSESDGCQKAK